MIQSHGSILVSKVNTATVHRLALFVCRGVIFRWIVVDTIPLIVRSNCFDCYPKRRRIFTLCN
jgi:hypothetical protein